MSHLWATTTVVRLVHTLASEAWMLRSVWVSRAEVACGEISVSFNWRSIDFTLQSAMRAKPTPHLIQQDDLRCFEDGPGDGDPLFLSSAQLQASFTHLRIIPCQRKTHGSGEPSRNATAPPCRSDTSGDFKVKCYHQEKLWFYRGCRQRWRPPPPPGRWRRCGRSGCCSGWCRWRAPCPGGPRRCGLGETSALPEGEEAEKTGVCHSNMTKCYFMLGEARWLHLQIKCSLMPLRAP